MGFCQKDTRIYSQKRKLSYSINNSEQGKILHISTDKSIYIYSSYYDDKNKIDPELRLSTQKGKYTYLNMITQNQTTCNFWLWYEHTWNIGQYLSLET